MRTGPEATSSLRACRPSLRTPSGACRTSRRSVSGPSAMSGQPCAAPGLTTSFASTPASFSFVDDHLGLLDRHQLVGVAVDDQRRRVVRRDVRDRRDLPADLADLRLVGDRHERLASSSSSSWKSNGGLEARRGCRGRGRPRPACRSSGSRSAGRSRRPPAPGSTPGRPGPWPSGRPASPAVPCISDRCPPAEPPVMPMRSGSMPYSLAWWRMNRTARCMSCEDLGDGELRLAAVDDGEDGVAAVEQRRRRTAGLIASCAENQPPLTTKIDAAAVGVLLRA